MSATQDYYDVLIGSGLTSEQAEAVVFATREGVKQGLRIGVMVGLGIGVLFTVIAVLVLA